MHSESLDQSTIDQIAEDFTASIRDGKNPSVDEYARMYPEAADQLRSLLTSIAIIEGLKKDSAVEPNEDAQSIEQLDDYTIVREIGRGGMGVVFEAIHQSLGRRVAVKILASRLVGDTKHLTRFRREARAAARLRHPNIVAVFGVGQSGDHHYYVMDFINGMSLRQWLQAITGGGNALPTRALSAADTDSDFRFQSKVGQGQPASNNTANEFDIPQSHDSPDYFRWVANLVATICSALQYAHQQGVLHRDIKPANLLIDGHGGVWIADFGLAKLAEPQAMTMTGDIVGTPQYMPPESFEAQYDVRSETYGVGLLLYELLTLRPAIEGKNTADVIRKATVGFATSPRKLNASIPRDLETIVLKSLSLDQDQRYQTAGRLRDDLRAFLGDRPISARRTSPIERAIRWSRREPTVAALTFATFALLFALAVVSAVGYARTSTALTAEQQAKQSAQQSLTEKTEALDVAEQQRQRAEKNLQVALEAFNKIVRGITDRGIEPDSELLGEVADTTSPNVTPADAELLQSLLGFFDELADTNSEDLLAESAEAGRRSGDIYTRLGKLREADRAYTDALDRYGELSKRDPDSLSPLIAQAQILNELAVVAGMRGAAWKANEVFRQTLRLFESSAALNDSTEGQFQYARAHRIYASLGARSGLDDLANRPRRPQPTTPRSAAMFKIRTEQDLRSCDEAIAVLLSLIDNQPEDVRFRAELGRVYRDKAKIASRTPRRTDAETAIRESIEIFESLLSQNRDSNAIRYELAKTLSTTETLGFNTMMRTIRANELSAALLRESPTLVRYQALRASTLQTLSTHQSRIGNSEAAERNLNDALELYESLVQSSPELMLYRTKQAAVLESLAELKQRAGDKNAAIQLFRQALRTLQPPESRFEASPIARAQLQRIRGKLNRLLE